jgi:hypothetical protein
MSSPPVGTVANQTARDLGLLPTAPALTQEQEVFEVPTETGKLFQEQAARIQKLILEALAIPAEMLGPDRAPSFNLFNYRQDDIRFFGRAGRK